MISELLCWKRRKERKEAAQEVLKHLKKGCNSALPDNAVMIWIRGSQVNWGLPQLILGFSLMEGLKECHAD